MKILFLTLSKINNIEDSSIYTDLFRAFIQNGHEISIVSPNERKYSIPTKLISGYNYKILNVWTTNFQKTNIIEKFFTTIITEYLYLIKIKKNLDYKNYNLIIYTTPPITFTNLIKILKRKSKAKTYLLLKDIFPQNAIDLEYLKKNTLLYKYLRHKEKILYKISDYIGCMSPKNQKYLLDNNTFLNISKVEVNPNSIEIKDVLKDFEIIRLLKEKFKIPQNKTIFIYGGNLGKPQAIEYLIENINYCKSVISAFFIIVGDGTEYRKLEMWINEINPTNILLLKEMPRNEYDQLIKIADVGLISLNPRFTIPNFPSRILNYLQNKLPVLLAVDKNTDIGEIAKINDFGININIENKDEFLEAVVLLLDEKRRFELGMNGFEYLKNEYSVDVTYKKIIEKLI